jgi:sporulation protein YlmC with PRC-barrel domain
MDIEYGATVKDKDGKVLGTVSRVVRDTWSSEIRKFNVSSELASTDLFYSVDDVAEASEKEVTLKIAFGEANLMGVHFGARVVDKNGKVLGTVDYPLKDSLTGEVRKFRIKTDLADGTAFFSVGDVAKATPSEVVLKVTLE